MSIDLPNTSPTLSDPGDDASKTPATGPADIPIDSRIRESHWLFSWRQDATADIEKRRQRLTRFVQENQIVEYEMGYRNLQLLLRQGGSPPERIKAVLRHYFMASNGCLGDYQGLGCPFDHLEMWGRNRTPLYLIGHPYQVWGDAITTLAAIRSLGMDVTIHADGWYGLGTVQVIVDHFKTAERFKRGEA
jgi:hypothetical protein